jgi:lysophospholipase L1-like esterase
MIMSDSSVSERSVGRRTARSMLRGSVVIAVLAIAVASLIALTTPATTPTVAVVGDSITLNAAHDISTALPAYRVNLHAELGVRIDQMLPTLRDMLRAQPFAVIVNLGTNDALQARTHPEWRRGFQQMIMLLISTRCVELTTINSLADGAASTTVASDMNHAITAAISGHPNLHLIDWNTLVHGPGGTKLLVTDNVHPSSAGQLAIAALDRAALDRDCGEP